MGGGGVVGKFLIQTFFICGSCCKQFFWCLRLPAKTFCYLPTIYFRFYSLCKQFVSKYSRPPLPLKNNGPSLIKTGKLIARSLVSYRHPLILYYQKNAYLSFNTFLNKFYFTNMAWHCLNISL